MNRREALKFFAPAVGLTFLTLVSGVGCTAPQWANFVTIATSFEAYVSLFIQGAEMAWAVLLPLLGANIANIAGTADRAFRDAMVALTNAVAVMADAVQAARLAQLPTLDLTAMIADIKDAVAKVMQVIAQFQPAKATMSVALSTHLDSLDARARSIAAWRVL